MTTQETNYIKETILEANDMDKNAKGKFQLKIHRPLISGKNLVYNPILLCTNIKLV